MGLTKDSRIGPFFMIQVECVCFESFFSFQLLQTFVGRRFQVGLAIYFLCKNMKEVFSGLQFLVLPKRLFGMADHESPRH